MNNAVLTNPSHVFVELGFDEYCRPRVNVKPNSVGISVRVVLS